MKFGEIDMKLVQYVTFEFDFEMDVENWNLLIDCTLDYTWKEWYKLREGLKQWE
jgi:hypothetical protein